MLSEMLDRIKCFSLKIFLTYLRVGDVQAENLILKFLLKIRQDQIYDSKKKSQILGGDITNKIME